MESAGIKRSRKQEGSGFGGTDSATSKETLSDVEKNEADTGASSSELDPGPSPDGEIDESDENNDRGSM